MDQFQKTHRTEIFDHPTWNSQQILLVTIARSGSISSLLASAANRFSSSYFTNFSEAKRSEASCVKAKKEKKETVAEKKIDRPLSHFCLIKTEYLQLDLNFKFIYLQYNSLCLSVCVCNIF